MLQKEWNSDFKEGRPPKYNSKKLNHAMELLETNSYRQVEEITGKDIFVG